MPRLSLFHLAVIGVSVAASATAWGQDLPPQTPIDLARGLRENGHADLAIEYLTEFEKSMPPEAAAVLPLERAKARLELANDETDDTVRQSLTTRAKAEFEEFLRASAKHPRAPEASVSLARLDSLQGRLALSRANRVADKDVRKADRIKTRDQFSSAAAHFKAAAGALEKLTDDPALAPPQKAALLRDVYQARLDEAVNLYSLSDTYDATDKADRDPRDKAVTDAEKLFGELSRKDTTHPLCWVARAWVGECMLQRSEPTKGEAQFAAIYADANKGNAPPAAAAGVRTARFFQLRDKYIARGQRPDATLAAVRDACEKWLTAYPSARATAELSAVRFYLGNVLYDEVLANKAWLVTQKAQEPATEILVVGVKAEGVTKLRQAEAVFHKVSETENEYTERAERQRAKAVRLLIGTAELSPEKYATFDECNMAALVQLEKLREVKDDERVPQALKAAALLERARQLPVTKEQGRDADFAAVSLARAYTAAGRPHQAAVLAEHIARTARSPKVVAQAGLTAVYAYAAAADAADIQDESLKANDLAHAAAAAALTEKAAPDDPVTDAVRYQHARLLNGFKRYPESFDVLHSVRPSYPGIATVRLVQGGVAFEILRAHSDTEVKSTLDPVQRGTIYNQAVADLSAVPAPAVTAKPDEWMAYFRVRLQLAQVYLTNSPAGYPLADKLAAETKAMAEKVAGLSPDQRAAVAMPAESIRIDAVFGQVAPLLKEGKYKEAADQMTVLLADVVKAGPASKPGQDATVADLAKSLDKNRMQRLLVPTLNARIREGAVDKTGELLDQLQKFGGDVKTSAGLVQNAVATIKPTVEALRKEGKADEAGKLVEAVGGLLTKLAATPNLPPEVLYNLGRAYRDLGDFTKAATLLASVPAPTNVELLKADSQPPAAPANETDEQRVKREASWAAEKLAASAYKFSQLELVRAYRQGKQFDKAAEVLDAVMGKDRKTGWAARQLDFRKEAVLLLEARGEDAANIKDATPHLVDAKKGWAALAGEYKAALDRPFPAGATEMQKQDIRRQKEMIKPYWHDLSYEQMRVAVLIQTVVAKHMATGDATAEALWVKNLGIIANNIADFEKNNKDVSDSVRAKFVALVDSAPPQLKKAYSDKGGKEFLPGAGVITAPAGGPKPANTPQPK